MSKPRRCRDCMFFDLPQGQRAYNGNRYRCTWDFKPMPLPDCITKHYGYNAVPPRSYIGPNDGTECPTFARAEGR